MNALTRLGKPFISTEVTWSEEDDEAPLEVMAPVSGMTSGSPRAVKQQPSSDD
jgi:hypothetical protein